MADITPGLFSSPFAGLAQGIASAGQGYLAGRSAAAQMLYQRQMMQNQMQYRAALGQAALDRGGYYNTKTSDMPGVDAAGAAAKGFAAYNNTLKNVQGLPAQIQYQSLQPIRDQFGLAVTLPGEDRPGHFVGFGPADGSSPAGVSPAPDPAQSGGLGPSPTLPAPPPPTPGTGSAPPPVAGPTSVAGAIPLNPVQQSVVALHGSQSGKADAGATHLGNQDETNFQNFIGLVPPGQQAAAVQDWNARNGTDYAAPVQTGIRPLNYGLNPAQVSNISGLRTILNQSQDPNATVSFGGKTYSRAQFDAAFPAGQVPVYSGLYAPNASQAAGIAQKQGQAAFSHANAQTIGPLRRGEVANGQTTAGAAVTRAGADASRAQTYAQTQPVIAKADETRAGAAVTAANTGAGRLNLDAFKYSNPVVTPADTDGLIKQQQAVIDQQNRTKNYLLTRRDKDNNLIKPTATDQAVINSADSQILEAQHNIRAFQRGVNPVSGQPLNKVVLPMPVTGVTNGLGQSMPGVSVPPAPRLPGFGPNQQADPYAKMTPQQQRAAYSKMTPAQLQALHKQRYGY